MRTLTTTCCIAGGGPAGIMLGFLLARSGVEVTVLEKWPDFFRDFRGDTIHPSTMQLLKELGLLEKFLALPHDKTRRIGLHIGGEEIQLADFTHLKTGMPFIAFIPQWDFLNFLSKEAKQYPNFTLLMETEVTDVLTEEGRVAGVMAKDAEGTFEIRADLTVGADGRHSTVREKANLRVLDSGAPIDVLWFKLPRKEDGTSISLGYVDGGEMMVLLNRTTYWQCAFLIQKGTFEALKAGGLEAFRKRIANHVPQLAESVEEIAEWDQVKMLSVAVDHLRTWYKPGLVCIGDAAHAMSPIGGVGINLAIQDAVGAANILAPAFASPEGVGMSDLARIQSRREWPARVVQKMQVYIHTHIMKPILATKGHIRAPWQLRLFDRFSILRRLPAYVIGVGVRPEHISTFIKDKK
tara:strand:- start:317094 stop:318320 length:1227 start_codon:yes stop_codon:yes gene_type:complete